MITLQQAQPRDRELLWNLLQKYLYEMTAYYPDKMEPDGTYPYRYFDAYFTEPERRSYLIYEDTELVGFAMTNPYPYIAERTEHVIAEFTIFPSGAGTWPCGRLKRSWTTAPETGRSNSMAPIRAPGDCGKP